MKELRPYQKEVFDRLTNKLYQDAHPLLVTASVGAGKSLIIAEFLLWAQSKGLKSLCLTLNSTLIKQNCDTYKLQGGDAGIFCSGLKAKDYTQSVIFASPQSLCQDIKRGGDISLQEFNIIVIDECHNINHNDSSSLYMRIINHYGLKAQTNQFTFRVIGLTGTPYRGKNESILGEHAFFKERICNISIDWLIKRNYLVKPVFGEKSRNEINFKKLKVQANGKFDQREISEIVDKNVRLTHIIMKEVRTIVETKGFGAFVFAATRRHCDECVKALPDGQWAIITAETPHSLRKEYLDKARIGEIKYLVSVNCLTVGVDVPAFDVCAWLRPTESLILYTQGIGRVLRLSEGKKRAIVLDYAGNIERHGDIDDPIINEALKPSERDYKDFCIPCYDCNTLNTIYARRCIGVINDKRCGHYFEFRACHVCESQNDLVARECRECGEELIDPNTKLRLNSGVHMIPVKRAEYMVVKTGGCPVIYATYHSEIPNVVIQEKFPIVDERTKNIAYSKFMRSHLDSPSKYYMKMRSISALEAMLKKEEIRTPFALMCSVPSPGVYKISKKLFHKNL